MRRLGSRKHIHSFSRENAPSYSVVIGERVVVETADAFSGKVRSEKVLFEDLDMADVNPATGPIEIDGISAGDVLAVAIERIKCGPRGVMMCSPELGNLSSEVRRSRTKVVKVGRDRAQLSKDLEIELRPHVGVIGVCPAMGSVPTFHPGDHGGNMDTSEVGAGSTVYLRTEVDGAMVSMGDVHAAMGDGEVCGTGVEVPAEVTVSFSKAEHMRIVRPMVETRTEWVSYAAARTLDEASKLATYDMVRFIADARGVSFEEAYMLASAVADLRISQVVDPLMAAKMIIKKRYL